MPHLATITSKRQLTIPVGIFQPARILIEELSEAVSLPKRFKGLSVDKIIKKAKQEYFTERK